MILVSKDQKTIFTSNVSSNTISIIERGNLDDPGGRGGPGGPPPGGPGGPPPDGPVDPLLTGQVAPLQAARTAGLLQVDQADRVEGAVDHRRAGPAVRVGDRPLSR